MISVESGADPIPTLTEFIEGAVETVPPAALSEMITSEVASSFALVIVTDVQTKVALRPLAA